MIPPELVKKRESKKSIGQCAICAGLSVRIVRLDQKFAVICKECSDTFSRKDLELMHNMFVAYGGYFGKCGDNTEETYQVIEEISREYASSGKDIDKVESDVRNLHRAFVHGISPVQLVKGLRVLVD